MNNDIIGIQGICYDEKSSFLKGPSLAPPIIRELFHSDSANMYTEDGTEISPEYYYFLGDYDITDYFEIEKVSKANSRNYKLITLGGDHSVSYPVIKALHQNIGEFDIIHIDAHTDLYESFQGDPYSHACPFARIMEGGHAKQLTQIGIRTLTQIQRDQAQKYNVHIIEMKDFSISRIPQTSRPTYLSIDIDALDPAFAPGVSHHEPGGLSTRQLLDIIHTIKAPIIGADIVEYNPIRDIHQMTAMVAAKMLKELIAKMKN